MNLRTVLKITGLHTCNIMMFFLRKKNTPVILMYHSFDTEDWKHGVDIQELDKQLVYLSRNKTIVKLDEFINSSLSKVSAEDVAITIDDGYKDTYSTFFPLAKKYKIPFTLFLTTNLIKNIKLGDLERPEINDIKEMLDSGLMTLGLHGHNHKIFPEVFRDSEIYKEITVSEIFIKNNFNVDVNLVAYPAGRQNEVVVDYFRKKGYKAGFLAHPYSTSGTKDIMKLSRIAVDRSTSFSLFKGRLGPGFVIYLKFMKILRKIPMW